MWVLEESSHKKGVMENYFGGGFKISSKVRRGENRDTKVFSNKKAQ